MKRTRALVLAGAMGLAGLGVGVTLVPAAASAAPSSTQAVTDRVTSLKNALSGLVKDGTITQAQADKVATTLDQSMPKGGGGHGFGRGADLETAASAIGITADELRTALEGGKTLAQVAQGKGVSQATLVEKLVAAAKTRLAADVKAGRITQAQADKLSADLTSRITEQVTSTRPAGGRGGHGGLGGGPVGGPDGAPGGGESPAPAPSASATS